MDFFVVHRPRRVTTKVETKVGTKVETGIETRRTILWAAKTKLGKKKRTHHNIFNSKPKWVKNRSIRTCVITRYLVQLTRRYNTCTTPTLKLVTDIFKKNFVRHLFLSILLYIYFTIFTFTKTCRAVLCTCVNV